MKKSPRITIKNVAEDSGVSVSAVSKVLRNAYGVSDSLREKVERSIKKLGYRPNTAARALRGRSRTIGLLVSDLRNPFVPDLIDGVREAADENKYRIMIGVGRAENANEQALVDSMIDQQMDGLILMGPRLSTEQIEAYGKQIPVVCHAYHHPDAAHFDTVNSDDADGASQATRRLIATGLARIHMVSLNQYDNWKTNVFYQREQSYLKEMDRCGRVAEAQVHRFPDPTRRAADWAERFLETLQLPCAIFCWSDIDGIALLSAAQSMGIDVPQSLSLIGFDDSAVAALPQIGLASVHQDGFALGRSAMRVLFERIEGRTDTTHSLIGTKLVERNSVLATKA
ncbi:LacI family DNA-binding transcriptional regulator [Yoonia sp. R2331]|uniref:LacI family DNA-binding transcriptional regulator n=1 Tax=Yoonia sp. R2331 TaxID=3237238 RepID=UPI0034E60968